VVLDVGAGNSSGLFNDLVFKDYNSVGGLAHFESGLIYWFPKKIYLQGVAYEQLPLGSQTVYRIVPKEELVWRNDDDGGGGGGGSGGGSGGGGGGNPPSTVTTVSEDNGFTVFGGVPLTKNFTLSGYYNRSLRQHVDTVSFGVTYVMRGPSRRRLSMIDQALREAEGGDQK